MQHSHQNLAALLATGLSGIQQSMAGMETRLAGKIDCLETKVSNNKESIVRLTDAANKNTVDLARLESGFRDRVASVVRDVLENDTARANSSIGHLGSISAHPSLSYAQMERYDRCRRSLRLWPIQGPDLSAGVRRFLIDKLQLSTDLVENDLDTLPTRRIVEPRSKVQSEVVVEFPSATIRDSVKSCGYKLEGQNAGIRIEVPNFLKSDFHVLQNLGYKMKLSNAGTKRSIKFDDEVYGLMLDVQVPGQDWQRIRPQQAREARRSTPSLRSGPLELTSDMISGLIRDQDSVDSESLPSGGSSASSSNSWPSDRSATGGNSVPLGRKPT